MDAIKAKKLFEASKEDYHKVVTSGMFWELFPELTGNYSKDMIILYEQIQQTTSKGEKS